jgi:DNA-binding transcriptional regulator YiaG
MTEERWHYSHEKRRRRWTALEVAALRARLGLSQAGLAARMGVRQQTVSEWETGRYAPRGASSTLLGMLAEEAAAYDSSPPATRGPGPRARK